jgi:hypothetical protein
MGTYPAEQRLVDGKCASATAAPALSEGSCALEAVGPSELYKAKGVEVKLVCMEGRREVMVCTNKKGHYMDAMTSGMPTDKRCAGFPDLLAVNMSTKGPNKALDRIFRDSKPESTECALQVKMIRRLENDPRFDTNQSTREVWANKVAEATRMGCNL